MEPSDQKDIGMMIVLLQRFTNQRLPRVNDIHEKLDQGEKLDDFDLAFLNDVLDSTNTITPLVERHPEYEPLVAKAIHQYKALMDKAVANEKMQ